MEKESGNVACGGNLWCHPQAIHKTQRLPVCKARPSCVVDNFVAIGVWIREIPVGLPGGAGSGRKGVRGEEDTAGRVSKRDGGSKDARLLA